MCYTRYHRVYRIVQMSNIFAIQYKEKYNSKDTDEFSGIDTKFLCSRSNFEDMGFLSYLSGSRYDPKIFNSLEEAEEGLKYMQRRERDYFRNNQWNFVN